MSPITDANVAARLEVARAAARSPRWPVYVPVNAAAAAWTAIVPAAARPWRLVEPDLIDLPDTAWAGKEGERHGTADRQQLGRQDDRRRGLRTRPIELSSGGFDMYPTYLARIASTAERACVMALDRPKDPQAREQLFDALAAVADPTFQADEPEYNHLTELFGQARVWADIVRTRIAGLQTIKLGHPAVRAVQYPARDLLPILGDLSRELGRRNDA